MSKSSRLVDWSDKLKHMEIKDVLDIDIGNISCEMSSQSSLEEQQQNNNDNHNQNNIIERSRSKSKSKSKSKRRGPTYQDDSFT